MFLGQIENCCLEVVYGISWEMFSLWIFKIDYKSTSQDFSSQNGKYKNISRQKFWPFEFLVIAQRRDFWSWNISRKFVFLLPITKSNFFKAHDTLENWIELGEFKTNPTFKYFKESRHEKSCFTWKYIGSWNFITEATLFNSDCVG